MDGVIGPAANSSAQIPEAVKIAARVGIARFTDRMSWFHHRFERRTKER
jgi:hypothetical protein